MRQIITCSKLQNSLQ